MLGADYPLLDFFWSVFIFFGFFLWIWLLVVVFTDLFRDHELSGWAKAAWFLLVLFVPLIGVIAYLIARGPKMHARAEAAQQKQEQEFRQYVQEAATGNGSDSTASQLSQLASLHDRGLLSDSEFEQQKAKILA